MADRLSEQLESEISGNIRAAEELENTTELSPCYLGMTRTEMVANYYYQAAEILWHNGHQHRAQPLINKVLKLEPDHEFTLLMIGCSPYGRGSDPPGGAAQPASGNPQPPRGSGSAG